MGAERLETGPVREGDDKGLHTTTRREMVLLPSGAVLIDTPGMREFGLWDAAAGLEEVFPEVVELAVYCRYRNCEHQAEPGCAVQEAVESGLVLKRRVESYAALMAETVQVEERARQKETGNTKRRHKALSKLIRGHKRLRQDLGLKGD